MSARQPACVARESFRPSMFALADGRSGAGVVAGRHDPQVGWMCLTLPAVFLGYIDWYLLSSLGV